MRREQIGGCCRSSGLGIVALRRSWREIFLWKTGDRQKEKRSKRERNGGLVETDAADGNPLTTRIPTTAWKAQNAFHSSHKARRRLHHRIYFSLAQGWGAPQTLNGKCANSKLSQQRGSPHNLVPGNSGAPILYFPEGTNGMSFGGGRVTLIGLQSTSFLGSDIAGMTPVNFIFDVIRGLNLPGADLYRGLPENRHSSKN